MFVCCFGVFDWQVKHWLKCDYILLLVTLIELLLVRLSIQYNFQNENGDVAKKKINKKNNANDAKIKKKICEKPFCDESIVRVFDIHFIFVFRIIFFLFFFIFGTKNEVCTNTTFFLHFNFLVWWQFSIFLREKSHFVIWHVVEKPGNK